MILSGEIKNFTKNTLILTLLFTLVLHLSWSYIRPYFSLPSFARNEQNFQLANATYLGGFATALSLNIGLREKAKANIPVALYDETITIAEALSDTPKGQRSLIADNMVSINVYLNLLKIDIGNMLDTATDRTRTLDEHIALLKTYYTRTKDKRTTIANQILELKNTITESTNAANATKTNISTAYKGMDYASMDTMISTYMKVKEDEMKARTFLTFLEKFSTSYATLQAENAKILDTLINNREAIIKRATVVVPDSGTELMRKLNLIQTEAEYKADSAK